MGEFQFPGFCILYEQRPLWICQAGRSRPPFSPSTTTPVPPPTPASIWPEIWAGVIQICPPTESRFCCNAPELEKLASIGVGEGRTAPSSLSPARSPAKPSWRGGGLPTPASPAAGTLLPARRASLRPRRPSRAPPRPLTRPGVGAGLRLPLGSSLHEPIAPGHAVPAGSRAQRPAASLAEPGAQRGEARRNPAAAGRLRRARPIGTFPLFSLGGGRQAGDEVAVTEAASGAAFTQPAGSGSATASCGFCTSG